MRVAKQIPAVLVVVKELLDKFIADGKNHKISIDINHSKTTVTVLRLEEVWNSKEGV